MPNTINLPEAGHPVDRLSLAVSAPRGAEASTYAAGCAACCCFADDEA